MLQYDLSCILITSSNKLAMVTKVVVVVFLDTL